MTDIYAKALSLLSRCERWVETGRSKGVITLQGLRGGRVVNEVFDESTLVILLSEGKVKCEPSERLAVSPHDFRPEPKEVQQKYWSVAK